MSNSKYTNRFSKVDNHGSTTCGSGGGVFFENGGEVFITPGGNGVDEVDEVEEEDNAACELGGGGGP
ncbi:hypothetical protein HMI55_001060 [Coelomomyces lativittatus]|nr:hypothetical protein HMI55_001060 [Coelomomyces lativittatus]